MEHKTMKELVEECKAAENARRDQLVTRTQGILDAADEFVEAFNDLELRDQTTDGDPIRAERVKSTIMFFAGASVEKYHIRVSGIRSIERYRKLLAQSLFNIERDGKRGIWVGKIPSYIGNDPR